jgi:hypothetical protein
MSKYMCLVCKFINDFYEFVTDWVWSDKENDEVPILKCPKCGNDDEEKIKEID